MDGWLSRGIVLGPRLGRFGSAMDKSIILAGHNLPLVALGGFVLYGWHGLVLMRPYCEGGCGYWADCLEYTFGGVCWQLPIWFYTPIRGKAILMRAPLKCLQGGLVTNYGGLCKP